MSDGFVSSDGSLTQDEIDALLGGGDIPSSDPAPAAAPSGGAAAAPVGGGSGPLGSSEVSTVTSLLNEVADSQGGILGGMVGTNITISNARLNVVGSEEFLSILPDEVVETSLDFNSGLSGIHSIIFQNDAAIKIAEPMIGSGELMDMDDTAVNALQEAISMMSGNAMTLISDKTGQNMMTNSPQSQKVPKAMLNLPSDQLVQVTYDITVEGAGTYPFYEIFQTDNIKQLAGFLGAEPDINTGASGGMDAMAGMGGMDPMAGMGGMGGMDPMAGMGGMGQNQAGGGMPQQPQMGMGQMGMGMGQQPQMGMGQMGMGQMGMGQMGMPQMGMPQQAMGMGGFMPQQPPQVQGIQYPNLDAGAPGSDQSNISLLMDVFMEVTVELGRTKKQIKDILGMGEGTIIELDKLAGEAVDILVNGHLIAKGEVVVIDENFGVRVTDIVSSLEGKMSEG